jgi:ABC-2 type transport system permease protein
MRKILTIALREYRAAVLTKAFLVGLAMMPLLMGGSIIIQVLFKDVKSTKDKTFVVIDRTPGEALFPRIAAKMNERNEILEKTAQESKQQEPRFLIQHAAPEADKLQQRFELSERVRKQEIFGFLDIGGKVLDVPEIPPGAHKALKIVRQQLLKGGSESKVASQSKQLAEQLSQAQTVRYYSNSPTYTDFLSDATLVLNESIMEIRSEQAKVDKNKVDKLFTPTTLSNKELARVNRMTGEIEDGKDVNFAVSFGVPFGIIMIMFMIIMVGATPLMQGVVEEKMQKIAEVLLASAKPFELMLGKLLGGVGVSLTLGSVYLIGGLFAAWYYGFTDYLSPSVVAWFLIFLMLAVLMFGSLFVAVGAACTDIKETQNLLLPVMLLATFPLFFVTKIIQEPDGALATGLSFFPFATPSLMVARIAIPPGVPQWWQPYVGVLIVVATTLFCVWIAGRIFRVGLLMQGKGASFTEIVKWAWKG